MTRLDVPLFSDAPPHELARRLAEATAQSPDFLKLDLTHNWFGVVKDGSFNLRYNLRGARGTAPHVSGQFQPCQGGTLIQLHLDSKPTAALIAMLFSTLMMMLVT